MISTKHWLQRKSSTGAVVVLSVALGASLAGHWDGPQPVTAADGAAAQVEQRATLAMIQNAFTSLAERVQPTVVAIEAVRTVRPAANPESGPRTDPFEGTPFEDLFRRFGQPGQPGQPMPRRSPRAGGSGVIVRENGGDVYVLTNQHVVDRASRLTVEMNDGREYPATLVGADSRSDLAVIKFSPGRSLGDKYVAALGDSDRVRVGQWAVAIGNPLGYEMTLTTGVISAKGRELDHFGGDRSYRGLIQTDASINPGNSGGPLVNIDGEVIGINVAIASPTGGNVGIGFAIPSNRAKLVMEQLIETGKVSRGYLGIATSRANAELSDELKRYYGVQGGALVEDVSPNTPAQKAGLKSEDVIVAFDGRPVGNYGELEDAVQATPPGKQVTVEIIRKRQPMKVTLTLAERPDQPTLAGRTRGGDQPGAPAPAEPNAFGFAVAPGPNGGAVIARVEPDSPAQEAGLAAGDTILAVDGTDVRDVAAWQRAIGGIKDKSAVLKVRRTATGHTAIVVLRQR